MEPRRARENISSRGSALRDLPLYILCADAVEPRVCRCANRYIRTRAYGYSPDYYSKEKETKNSLRRLIATNGQMCMCGKHSNEIARETFAL